MASQPIVVTVKDDVIHLSSLGAGVFTKDPAKDPGRPFAPAFISGDPARLEHLDENKTVIAVNLAEQNKEVTGTITTRMIFYEKTYESPYMKSKLVFPRTLDFEVLAKGFRGANPIAMMLPDRMQFRISVAPLAIPYIRFEGKISDLSKAITGKDNPLGGSSEGILGTFVGLLTKWITAKIELDLIEQVGLSDQSEGEHDYEEEFHGSQEAGEDKP